MNQSDHQIIQLFDSVNQIEYEFKGVRIGSNWISRMTNISDSLINISGPTLNAYFSLIRHAITLQLHAIKSIKVELSNAKSHIALACLVQEIYVFENPDDEFIQSDSPNNPDIFEI